MSGSSRRRLEREAVIRREVPEPTYEMYSGRKMAKTEISDSAQRLSRVPHKYNSMRTTKTAGQDTFAANYFANNPEHVPDKRPPQEKLDEIHIRLEAQDIDDNDKFNLLIQQKSLCVLAYGENSAETLAALIDLGKFYNEQNRPESALRNLSKAQQISKSIDIEDDEGLALSIELATANLDSKASNKTEQTRQLTNAESIMKPYQDYDSDDKNLLYRRDLVIGRMLTQRQNYSKALDIYERAMDNLNKANNNDLSPETATLYDEMGETALKMNDRDKANEFFQKGYDTFESLDMNDSAELIARKIRGGKATSSFKKTYDDDDIDNDTSLSLHRPVSSTLQNSPQSNRKNESTLETTDLSNL